MTTIGARLKDPYNVAGSGQRLAALQDKITACMTRLFRQPKNGGNPFLFALTAPKPHELATTLPGSSTPFTTAATDGKKFWWNPDFLEKLSVDEVPTVMEHEGWHVYFFHPQRGRGCNPRVFNWAVDYVVNAVIEVSREKAEFKGKLWGGALGDPLSFKDLLAFIDGKQEIPDNKTCIFADKSLHGRSPESIYEEIMKHWDKSPRKCPQCGALSMDPKNGKPKPQKGPGKGQQQGQGQKGQGQGQGQGDPQKGQGQGQGGGCGHDHGEGGDACGHCGAKTDPLAPMDEHIQGSLTKDEVMSDLMRAAQQTKAMGRGSVPSEVEDMLGELYKPSLKFQDIVRSALMRKVQDAGMKNDWKRIRRRWLAASPKQYLPRRHTHMPRWIAMLDTSGSMGDDDLTYGISQLQVLGNNTEGYIIPCDASPKWDEVKKIGSNIKEDLKRTKIVGRGGTVFDEFFRDFPAKLGKEFDVLVVITDGDCGTIPIELKPVGMDVVWIITRKHKDYKPSFGRVCPLRNTGP